MGWKKTAVCDVCKTEKATTNHWFIVVPKPSVLIHPDDVGAGYMRGVCAVFSWSARAADMPRAVFICGAGCLSRHFSTVSEHNAKKNGKGINVTKDKREEQGATQAPVVSGDKAEEAEG